MRRSGAVAQWRSTPQSKTVRQVVELGYPVREVAARLGVSAFQNAVRHCPAGSLSFRTRG